MLLIPRKGLNWFRKVVTKLRLFRLLTWETESKKVEKQRGSIEKENDRNIVITLLLAVLERVTLFDLDITPSFILKQMYDNGFWSGMQSFIV